MKGTGRFSIEVAPIRYVAAPKPAATLARDLQGGPRSAPAGASRVSFGGWRGFGGLSPTPSEVRPSMGGELREGYRGPPLGGRAAMSFTEISRRRTSKLR